MIGDFAEIVGIGVGFYTEITFTKSGFCTEVIIFTESVFCTDVMCIESCFEQNVFLLSHVCTVCLFLRRHIIKSTYTIHFIVFSFG